MNRDEHEREIFEQALNLPGDPDPYDIRQPFDAQKLLSGFIEDERVVHAEDDPVLGEMAAQARDAWAAFLGEDDA